MMEKKLITGLLLCITLLIVVIPTIPHHHHDATSICLNSPEYDDEGSPSIPIDHSACGDNCVTHIKAIHSDVTKSIQFEEFSFQLFNIQLTKFVITFLCNSTNRSEYLTLYLEKLYPTPITSPHGLRAPPYRYES